MLLPVLECFSYFLNKKKFEVVLVHKWIPKAVTIKEHGVWAEAGNRSGLFIVDITGHVTHYGVPYVMVHSTTKA